MRIERGKLAVIKESRDGFEDNVLLNRDVNNRDGWSVRGQLLFDIAADTSLLLTADHQEADNEPLVFETLSYNNAKVLPQLLAARGFPRNADPFDRSGSAEMLARRTRAVVEHAVDEAITRSGRALGPGPLCQDGRHAQRVADLTIYVRQSHAERDLATLGRIVGQRT